jgi:DNA primase
MALPPGFLDELRARPPLPGLIGRKTRLLKSGRNWKGCCPFHGEKTPSFYVYDDHFHCFGCGAHGDAVTFVMQAEGAQFMEAVERLAAHSFSLGAVTNSENAYAETPWCHADSHLSDSSG